jgi:hypothetical protein
VIDEFDTVLSSTEDDKAALRSVINSGHVRGQGVLCCEGDEHRPEMFPTFAPKAIGMIGKKLPPATLGRCISIELRRRLTNETIERFAHHDDDELGDLRRRLRRWSMDHADALKVEVSLRSRISVPAERSGGTRHALCRTTSIIGGRHIRRLFAEDQCEYFLSGRLVDRLKQPS